jgi:hypothetical protein
MKRIEYIPDAHALVVEGLYETRWRDWFGGYVGPLEQVSEVSLVSFRKAAARYIEKSRHKQLLLGWADHPTEHFEAGNPAANLVRLRSDGDNVFVVVHLSLYDTDNYPESSDHVSALLDHTIQPLLEPFDARIADIAVEAFDPTASRGVEVTIQIAPQRRILDDAYRLGQSVRDCVQTHAPRVLGTISGVINALSFAPAALVGQPESTWLEVKRKPYDLEREEQRIEIAKDIAAFANAGGGLIIFGFSTRSRSGVDVITRARSIDTSSVSPQRYSQIVRARVFPMPEKLTFVRLGDGKQGFAYIKIPHQPEELRPFFLRKTLSGSGVTSTSLTIPVRTGAEVEYGTAESIHSLIVAGRVALRSVG